MCKNRGLKQKSSNQQTAMQGYISHLHQQCQILQLQSPGVNCTSVTSFGQFNKGFKQFSAIQQPMQYDTRNATRVSEIEKHTQSVQTERRQQHDVNAGDGFAASQE